MDPITIVSLAGNIITFVDFATELISGTAQLYKSPTGQTSQNIHIENVISDLHDVADDLDTVTVDGSKAAKRIKRLASNCKELALELLALLKQLKLDGNKNKSWNSLLVKWKNIRKADEVMSIEKRLGEYRSEILLELSLLISDQQSSISRKLETMKAEAAQLNSRTRQDLDSIESQALQILANSNDMQQSSKNHSEEHAEILQLLHRLEQLNSNVPLQHRILRQLMYSSMHAREETIHDTEFGTCDWLFEASCEMSESEPIISEAKNHEEVSKNDYLGTELENHKLNEKSASSMNSQTAVDYDGSEKSRNEIFEDSATDYKSLQKIDEEHSRSHTDLSQGSENLRKHASHQFISWLKSGSGIFHICGKAGSGKSTLMKHIWRHPKTRCELEEWAAGNELVLAKFYFSSNSGDESQMSLDSLHRSILFECLTQCPELIPEVFPSQWQTMKAAAGDILLDSIEFRKSRILDAFKILKSKQLNTRYRFCFFIDGLDEYHGDTYDHWQLAKMLRDLSSGKNLKICASSRPHTEYMDTFTDSCHTRILLQNLNTHDIYLFSRRLLENDRNFPQIQSSCLDLADQIAHRSDGVFLWAVFAVRLLLTSLAYDEDFEALSSNLDLIPEELSALYEKLLASVSKHDRKRCDRMLYLTLMNPFQFPLAAVSYSWIRDLEDPMFPFVDCVPYTEDEIIAREKSVERQLDKLTKGLLEIIETSMRFRVRSGELRETRTWKKVQFLHRTFRDFLREKAEETGFLQHVADFSLGEIYGRMRLAEISYQCPHPLQQDFELFSMFVTSGMYALSPISTKLPRLSSIGGKKAPDELCGLPVTLTKRIRFAVQSTLLPISCATDRCQNGTVRHREHGSFLHLAVATGHQEYALGELDHDPNFLNHETEDLSLVLSALSIGHSGLALELLRRGGSMHQQITLHSAVKNPSNADLDLNLTAPIWMAAVYQALETEFSSHIIGFDRSSRILQFWEFILKHMMSSIDADEWNCEVHVIDNTVTSFKFVDLLQVLARHYSSLKTSTCLTLEYWQIVNRVSAGKSMRNEGPSLHTFSEPLSPEASGLLAILKRFVTSGVSGNGRRAQDETSVLADSSMSDLQAMWYRLLSEWGEQAGIGQADETPKASRPDLASSTEPSELMKQDPAKRATGKNPLRIPVRRSVRVESDLDRDHVSDTWQTAD